jgi:hypothetical protein
MVVNLVIREAQIHVHSRHCYYSLLPKLKISINSILRQAMRPHLSLRWLSAASFVNVLGATAIPVMSN